MSWQYATESIVFEIRHAANAYVSSHDRPEKLTDEQWGALILHELFTNPVIDWHNELNAPKEASNEE
jgi:hypothetical protein